MAEQQDSTFEREEIPFEDVDKRSEAVARDSLNLVNTILEESLETCRPIDVKELVGRLCDIYAHYGFMWHGGNYIKFADDFQRKLMSGDIQVYETYKGRKSDPVTDNDIFSL